MADDPPTPPAAPVPTRSGLLSLAVGLYGVVALFALGYALVRGQLDRLLGEPGVGLGTSWEGLAGALGVGLGLVVLTRVGSRAWRPMRRLTRALVSLLGPIRAKEAALLGLVSGVAEELLFRGALWPDLDLAGTTLLFAIVHTIPRRGLWLYPVFAAVAGLFLGLLREATDSVLPPMVAHVTVNALNLAWLGARARRPGRG